MTRYTTEYADIQRAFHVQRPDYGVHAHRWAETVMNIAQQLNTSDILDYGAGKGTLQKNIPFPITQYDPFVPEFAREPAPAALVCCLDTLEHIEPDCLTAVLSHISSLTRNLLFCDIALRPAGKFLPDGRNAHLIVESGNWWLARLLPYFTIRSFTLQEGSCIILAAPHGPTAPAMQSYLPGTA